MPAYTIDPPEGTRYACGYTFGEMRERMEWQLMESAPKDGSYVLAWRSGWDRPAFVEWILDPRASPPGYSRRVCEPGFWWSNHEMEFDQPTHWLPIPSLPGQREMAEVMLKALEYETEQ